MLVEGSFTVAASRESVWDSITDPRIMAPCVPGCEGADIVDPTHYKARVKIELGPIKASFNLEIEVTEQVLYDHILSTTRGEEGSRASMVSAKNSVTLTALGGASTEIRYTSEVSVTGRLGKFGLGLMKKKADTLGKQFAERFREAVEQKASAA